MSTDDDAATLGDLLDEDPQVEHTLDMQAVSVRLLAVREMPGSATPEDQFADAGIDSRAITSAALTLARP